MKGTVGDAVAGWVALCQRRPWPVLLVVVLLSVSGAGAAWRFAAIDSDLSRLIRPSDALRWYQYDQQFKAAFPELQQTAVVVVSGADAGEVEAVARRLADSLRARAELDFVYAPTLDPFLAAHRLYFLELETLTDWIRGVEVDYGALLRLSDSAGLSNAAMTFADQVSAGSGLPLPNPLASLARSFANAPAVTLDLDVYPPLRDDSVDVHYTLLQVKGLQHHDRALPGAELVELLNHIVEDTAVPEGVAVRLTGEVVLATDEIGAALEGIGIAGTLSLLLLALILGLGVRSLRIIVAIGLLLLTGSVLTLGFAALTVGTFNTLALMFVIMFFGLGVDFAVHFALRVRDAHASGQPDGEACVAAARDIGPALLLCMATSCIAFLSFAPTAYRGLAELGIISAAGMVIAVGLTLTLIPALFGAFGMPTGNWGRRMPKPHAVARRPLPVLTLTLSLALVAAWWARDLRFDYSVLALRDAETEAMSTLLELQDRGIGTDYSISVLAPDAASASALTQRLEALPEVAEVTGPGDWIPGRQAEKQRRLEDAAALLATIEGVQPAEFRDVLPEAIEYLAEAEDAVPADWAAAYRNLLEGLRLASADPEEITRLDAELQRELEEGLNELRDLLTAEPFGIADLPVDVSARMIAPDGRWLLSVSPAVALTTRESVETFISAVAAVAPNYAGRAVVEWGVGDVVVTAFVEAATLAVVCILGLLVIYFRSLVLPVLVLVPLLLSLLLTFGLAQALGLSLNMANVLVVPLIFGLGVDTGIHVVHRFAHDGGIDAVFSSSTARAVTISALTTIGTFVSLSFSPHKGAASVGLLLSLAISLMLLATYVVLPVLLHGLRAQGRTRHG